MLSFCDLNSCVVSSVDIICCCILLGIVKDMLLSSCPSLYSDGRLVSNLVLCIFYCIHKGSFMNLAGHSILREMIMQPLKIILLKLISSIFVGANKFTYHCIAVYI